MKKQLMGRFFLFIFIIGFSFIGSSLFLYEFMNPSLNFNFVFKYGILPNRYEVWNELNTFNETFTKDMVVDPPITINLVLSEEEMMQILEKMIEIDFFNYPEEFPLRPNYDPHDCECFYIKAEYNSTVREVSWNEYSLTKNFGKKDLIDLIVLIHEILETKAEYTSLPKPKACYV